MRNSVVAFGFQESGVEAMSVSEEERRRVFQENWDKGNGFRFMFGTFCDIATNPEANAAAAAFIRSKIKEIVKDPETARKLTPTGLYSKRPLRNEGYYETFNRDNVTLVSIEENPIEAITPAGVRTADGVEHRLDVLVFATGFDAVDGNYRSMDLRGRGGRHINEGWAAGASSYLGVSTHGFPNLFMILGPNGPFTNLPPSIESQVDWISETIRHAERSGIATVEPSREAEDSWTKTCQEIADMTLFPKVEFLDLRRQHPRQEEHGYVLHGRYRRLPSAARGCQKRRLQRVRLQLKRIAPQAAGPLLRRRDLGAFKTWGAGEVRLLKKKRRCQMLMRGKVCVLTGAASPRGIGRATAHMLASHGAHIVVIDITENVNEPTCHPTLPARRWT